MENRRSTLTLAWFLAIAAFGFIGCTDPSAVTPEEADFPPTVHKDDSVVTLKDSDLPWQKLYVLSKADALLLTLPDGQQVRWLAKGESLFGASEQTTACGLRFDLTKPPFAQLKRYGVSTSSASSVSIYSFGIGDYHVNRAVDLRCDYALMVIIKVEKTGALKGLDHAEARALFDKEARPDSAEQLRVPITTVHHGLNETFGIPVRLVLNNADIRFHISGNVHQMPEHERVQLLTSMMDYIVKRYESIDRADKLAFDVLKQNDTMFQYEAHRDESGNWNLHKL